MTKTRISHRLTAVRNDREEGLLWPSPKGAVQKELLDSPEMGFGRQEWAKTKKLGVLTPPVFAYYGQCIPNPIRF